MNLISFQSNSFVTKICSYLGSKSLKLLILLKYYFLKQAKEKEILQKNPTIDVYYLFSC